MEVIFLDHDGVICLDKNWGSRNKKQEKWGGRKMSMSMSQVPIEYRFDNFDKKAVETLNEILEETGAEIVVSSDWRKWATVEELGEYYKIQGIIKKPIGFTEFFYTFEEDLVKELAPEMGLIIRHSVSQNEQERHVEIKKWLKDHPEVEKWVAVDDLNMGIEIETSYGKMTRDWGLENFVWTPRDWEGIKQSGIKEEIIKILK